MNNQKVIPSVNYHLWEPCNMRCRFCFATFQDVKAILPKGHLPRRDALTVVQKLCDFGFKKITFVGGEPTLCPWLYDLIALAKENGVTTMIVTNGSKLNPGYLQQLQGALDWITISIDSVNELVNLKSGRYSDLMPTNETEYINRCRQVLDYGFRLKINTVVHKLNCDEILSDFICTVNPERWKVFKLLPVIGQNSTKIEDLAITDVEFNNYIQSNSRLARGIELISENNNEMSGSYLMIDPAGRFFDNTKGFHSYSTSINETTVENAIKQINSDYSKFIDRKGLYRW
jgi:radical S-adenosyl methionine domain-containing protein 2